MLPASDLYQPGCALALSRALRDYRRLPFSTSAVAKGYPCHEGVSQLTYVPLHAVFKFTNSLTAGTGNLFGSLAL